MNRITLIEDSSEPTPEQWEALRAVQARIHRNRLNVARLRVDTAALTLEVLAGKPASERGPESARSVFHALLDTQSWILGDTSMAEDEELASTLERLPALLDQARELVG